MNNLFPRYRHTVTAASLGPGLTEVIIFGGYNHSSFIMAATTLLQFSKWCGMYRVHFIEGGKERE